MRGKGYDGVFAAKKPGVSPPRTVLLDSVDAVGKSETELEEVDKSPRTGDTRMLSEFSAGGLWAFLPMSLASFAR